MKNKALIYVQIIALIAGVLTCFFSVKTLIQFKNIQLNLNIWLILGVFVLFILLHSLKLVRYYFILSETPISIETFIPIYLQTTLLNILLPFKIGEIYRLYIIGETIDNYSVSLLSIITERFFDTGVVAIILTTQIFLFQGSPDSIYLFFLIFVGTLFFVYKMYPQTYHYLNAYFVRKNDKARDILALQFLRKLDHVYCDERNIVKDRSALVFLLSFFSWIVEYFLLSLFSKIIRINFNFGEFSTYIKSILSLPPSSATLLSITYIILSTILLGVLLIGFKLIFLNKRKDSVK